MRELLARHVRDEPRAAEVQRVQLRRQRVPARECLLVLGRAHGHRQLPEAGARAAADLQIAAHKVRKWKQSRTASNTAHVSSLAPGLQTVLRLE